MAQMHAIAARSTASVEEKRFSLFVSIQYLVKLASHRVNALVPLLDYLLQDWPVRKKHASSQEYMRYAPGWPFKTFKQSGVNPSSTELVYEFVVVNHLLFAISWDASLDVPRGNNLLMGLGAFRDRFCSTQTLERTWIDVINHSLYWQIGQRRCKAINDLVCRSRHHSWLVKQFSIGETASQLVIAGTILFTGKVYEWSAHRSHSTWVHDLINID